MKIAIGTDHRGVEIKKQLIDWLCEYEIIDCSTDNYDTDDYPDFAYRVCKEVSNGTADDGVLICGTGIGMSIAANKCKGIRCALVNNLDEARLAKEHNAANVIALGENHEINDMVDMIRVFVQNQPSSEEKHKRRVEKVMKIESGEYNEL